MPCTIFASRVYIYIIYSLPAIKSCVCKLYKENIMYMYIVTHKSITSLIIENDVHNMKKKKRQIILWFIRVTYLRNFHHPLRMMYVYRLKRNKWLSCDDSSRSMRKKLRTIFFPEQTVFKSKSFTLHNISTYISWR